MYGSSTTGTTNDEPDLHRHVNRRAGRGPVRLHQRHYADKAEAAQRDLGSYDWRISSADKLKAYQNRRDLFTRRWVEFYQVMKVIRAKQAPLEGGVA